MNVRVGEDPDSEQELVQSSALVFAFNNSYPQCNATNTGAVQPSWGRHLAGITKLDLSSTNISGQLPAQWSHEMPRLEILDLSDNPNLNGPIPKTWAATGAFPSLSSLVLSRCSFGGNLPGGQQPVMLLKRA